MADETILVLGLVLWAALGVALFAWSRIVARADEPPEEPWAGPSFGDVIHEHLELRMGNARLRQRAA